MENSFWIDSTKNIAPKFKSLNKNLNCDVCIIGGGITGISTAYKLSQKGLKVIVLERDFIGSKATGHTTGKLSSQHDVFYKYLVDSKGSSFAKDYLQANENAILDIKNIIDSENIDCDFEFQDSYVFSEEEKEIPILKEEASIINSLGLSANYLESLELPLDIKACVKFPNQAQFHPLKYIYGLANCIIKRNGEIYEKTTVYDIEKKDNVYVTRTDNYTVSSEYVIVTSRYPFLKLSGLYFLKMYQSMSYAIACKVDSRNFSGMYINTKEPIISFRYAKDENKNILIVTGNGHKVGENKIQEKPFELLENIALKLHPEAQILNRWCTEDCISLDKIPYIGNLSESMPKAFVATGFKKWGLTTSNIASNLLTDLILGKENHYKEIFLSKRFEPIKNREELTNMIKESVSSLVIDKFKIPEENLKDISNGEGKIIDYNSNKIGVYKNENGKVYAVKPICTHLGCLLEFNNIEKTWDCPCHGSRFSYDGTSIYSPAMKNLDKYEL